MFISEYQRTIQILIVKSFRFSRTRISDFLYSFQWINDFVSLQNVINQFRVDIEQFRRSKVFRNFLIRFQIVNSTFSNSISSFVSRIFKLEIFIQSIVFNQFDASIRSKFRRSNFSENFSSQTFSYFSIINFNLDNESNTFRQFIVEREIIDSEQSIENTQFDNNEIDSNQTFLFINTNQTKEIHRNISSIRSFFEIDQFFWNNIMIVIIAFVSMFRFVDKTFFSVDNNNVLQSIIRFAENVDYFDSNYENSIDTDQSIVSFEKHNFYRDVYIFIDYFKNLNKITSDSKIKKLVLICFKRKALRWYNSKFIEIENNFFKNITIERWCTHLIKRFKKKDSIVLKKLQSEF